MGGGRESLGKGIGGNAIGGLYAAGVNDGEGKGYAIPEYAGGGKA